MDQKNLEVDQDVLGVLLGTWDMLAESNTQWLGGQYDNWCEIWEYKALNKSLFFFFFYTWENLCFSCGEGLIEAL